MSRTALPETGEPSPSQSRFSSGNIPVRNDADVVIAPLLSRANLLKVRGQWEEAVTVCAEAIRRSPDSASAHALLGDIYLAQGKNGDALHWYRMALDRNPLQTGLLEKHNHLLAEQKAVATGGFSTTNLGGINRTLIPGEPRSSDNRTARFPTKSSPVLVVRSSGRTTGRVTVERTLDWFDRVFPQNGTQGMPRTFFVISALIAVFVLAAGTVLFFTLRKSDVQEEQSTILSEVRPVASLNIPPSSAPSAVPVSVPSLPATPVLPAATPAATLMETLSSLNGEEITVTAAQADPSRGQAQLEIALPSHPGETLTATRNRILQASAKVSQAAFTALPTLQRFSVRVLLRSVGTTGPADAVNANLVFVGETSGVALRTLSSTSPVPDYALLSALFTNTWWANNLNTRMP